MTQEERQLLLKDLCGRLPYGVKIDHFDVIKELLGVIPSSENVMVGYDINDYEDSVIEDIKPYLRPMNTMTAEEKIEWRKVSNNEDGFVFANETHLSVDWLNENMFDYRGLIPMGLALEAPEGVY